MSPQPQVLAILQSLGWPELLVIGVIALLIFGKRLPEVGRSLGQSFVEFKKGLKDTTDQLHDVAKVDTDEKRETAPRKEIRSESKKSEQVKSFNEP